MSAAHVLAYSLIELLAVVTLLTVATGLATVNMQGLSDEATLRACADQLAACTRLAADHAARTGRPHVLAPKSQQCTVRRPVLREGAWAWDDSASLRLVPKCSVADIADDSVQAGDAAAAAWLVPVAPGDYTLAFDVLLRLHSGVSASARLSGRLGIVDFKMSAE